MCLFEILVWSIEFGSIQLSMVWSVVTWQHPELTLIVIDLRKHLSRKPSWWKQRTTLEKFLTIVTVLALIAIAALAISLVSLIFINKSQSETQETLPKITAEALERSPGHLIPHTCTTPGCVRSAVYAMDSIDSSVEPCDDFFQFACGNFIKKTKLPDDKYAIYPLSLINDKLQQQITELITEEASPDESKPFRLAKDLYKACNNLSLIEEIGTKPYLKIVEELGGWPVVVGDEWNTNLQWTWVDTVKKFSKIGFETNQIFDFAISIDLKNSSRRIVDIDQSSFGLNREFLIKGVENEIVKAYYDYMVDTAVIYGANRETAEISLPQEERRNASALYNPTKLSDVQKMYPYIDWVDYCNALLPDGVSVDDSEIITVSVPSFFEKLADLLEETPNRTIANYLIWRITVYSTYFMSSQLRKRNLEYFTKISGKTEDEARWKECVDLTISGLPISVGALYVKKHFEDSSKASALEIVDGIREQFEKILQTVDWMDEVTRQSALEKLSKMATYIAYPDEIKNNTLLEEYYNGLEIDPEHYLESHLKINVFTTNKIYEKLREPVNKGEWIRHAKPAQANAYYSAIENSIEFPAGILQEQFFSADRPKYMNFAGIGFVVGHEITHGFDDKGRQFDGNGNLVEWWNEETISKFREKAQCIIEQYGNYTDEETGLNLNGINSQGENIADNGGIIQAYLAYQKWVANNGEEPILPGLDYNPNQLFWLSAVQSWCAVYRTEILRLLITTNDHPPSHFRMRGILSNMPEFSTDFNCPVGSPMNPVHKCKVW
ncbi:Neprilysin-2 [Pseudolycoriella hygida]|uniref:Neprilysin-2 n=1 Tax=Pseudolycoriella hygida TaxID=35572 RepID=A0A9Q0MP50_9DIPT|nr:Neprilysin-2 [Pseudolycoriella hygida]